MHHEYGRLTLATAGLLFVHGLPIHWRLSSRQEEDSLHDVEFGEAAEWLQQR